MAVTAKFVADFSSFNQAIDRALGNLDKFKKGAEGAEKSLGRMVDNFSGQKMIREAMSMAAAVEAVGGKAVLTEKELEQVGNTAKEAADKLKLLGKDVPQNLQDLAKHAQASTKELGLMDQVLRKIGPALVSAFSVGAIVGFVKEIGSFAGRMKDLSAETQIGTTRLQALNFMAADVGLTVEDVTGAVTQMSRRIAGGDDSAAAAIERLGLNIHQIQQLNPSDAFVEIGEAIAKIENPMERTRTAMELFGKSGSRMLRLMSEDMGKMLEEAEKGGGIISEHLIDKADEFDDKWTKAIMHVKGLIVTMAGAVVSAFSGPEQNMQAGRAGVTLGSRFQDAKVGGAPAFTEDAIEAAKLKAELDKMVGKITAPANPFGPGAAPPLPDMSKIKAQVDWRIEMERAAAAAKALEPELRRLAAAFQEWETKTKNAAGEERMKEAAAGFSGIQSAVDAGMLAIEGAVPQLAAVGTVGKTATNELERMAIALYNLPAALNAASDSAGVATGGQGFFGKLFGGLQGGLSGMLEKFTGGKGISGIFSKIGTGIFEGFGNIISGGLSSLISGGLGLAVKGIGKLFGGLFGGEGKKVNDMRDQFISAAGGIDVLAAKAQAAGTSVDKLLAAKKVKDFEKAVQDLEGTLGRFADQTEKDQLRLQEAIEKYGFTLSELGPMLQKQKLDTQATDLAEDWRVLMAAGVDVNAINQRMEESVMAYLDAAKSVGAEVPASMRPVLQSMIDTGTLTDEAGKAFESLDAAGITFASTLTDVVDKLDELIDKLGELGSMPNINVGMPTIPEGGFAGGTGGRYLNFGRGTPVMLHGRERVSTEAEGRAEASGLSSLAASMDAIRRDFATFPELMRDALQTRVVVAH